MWPPTESLWEHFCGSGTFLERNVRCLLEKGALKLPECCCLVICVLMLLQLALKACTQTQREGNTTAAVWNSVISVSQSVLCKWCSVQVYLCRGGRRWPRATLSTLPLLSIPCAPRLIHHLPVFSCHNLQLNWNAVCQSACAVCMSWWWAYIPLKG